MADFVIDYIAEAAAGKATTANAAFNAVNTAFLFGNRLSSTSGLTWGYYGGIIMVGGARTLIADGTVLLTNAATNYVEVDAAGAVSVNTSGPTAGKLLLHTLVTSGGAVVPGSSTEHRTAIALARFFFQYAAVAMADADKTLTQAQALCDTVECTGALTAGRNLVAPTARRRFTVFNNTTGGFAVTVKTPAGSGVAVAMGERALVESDGTNVVVVARSNSSYVLPTASASVLGGVKVGNGTVIDGSSVLATAEPVNAQTGTAYTYVTGDRAKLVTHANASAIAATLPQAGASFPDGWYMDVADTGAGTLTITPTTSTIDGQTSLVLTQGQGVRLVSDGTNYRTVRGAGGYTLPTASASVLGGVKVGSGLSIDGSGVLSASGSAPGTSTLTDFAQDVATTTGLTYGYQAGRIRDGVTVTAVAAGTLLLTASSTNYVEVSGAGTVSANTTGFTAGRYPMATVTTDGSAVTGVTDKRGVIAVAVNKAEVNVFTKNQSVTPVALTDGANIAVDASLSNNFKVTLGGNRTLDNPTNLTDGMVLNFVVKQDATGSRTLAYGTKYDFGSAGTPTLSTGANKVDFISAYYDSAADKLLATFRKSA